MELRETQLAEARYDRSRGELTLTVIRPGFNKSKRRFYPPETLRRDYRVFEGVKMFMDHATTEEERRRPEGSIRDWAASIKRLWVDGDGTVRATAAVIDDAFRGKLENLARHDKLGEMGVSIRAAGEARETEVEGHATQYVERLLAAHSVDFVTRAGAGGGVDMLESDDAPGSGETNVNLTESFKQLFRGEGYSEAEAQRLAAAAVPEEGRVTNAKEEVKVRYLEKGYDHDAAEKMAAIVTEGL